MKFTEIPASQMKLLPPSPDKCQECAVAHNAEDPHNPQSMYYQVKFQIQHGRGATWNDALAHCTPERQGLWWENLKTFGITKENGKVNAE